MPEKRTNRKEVKEFTDKPHSLEAEQSLLGCLLMSAEVQNEIMTSLAEEDFYAESHIMIFNAMNDLLKANQPLDLVSLVDMLDKKGELVASGGIEYLTSLSDVMPSTANYAKYFEIVKRNSILRKLIDASSQIISNCTESTDSDESLAFAEKRVFDIAEETETSNMEKISAVIPSVMARIDQLSKDKSALRGIRTGYRDLDNIIDGVHRSDLMILAARPGCGKTSLAMNIVENIALAGHSCAIFSLEMSKEQLVTRMLCSISGVSMERVSKGQMNKADWIKVAKARELLSNSKIYINESSVVRPQEIISKCRRQKRKTGLDFVVIDYIQLMTADDKKDSRQQEITEISRSLKVLAKEINVPVLALSQLSRDIEKRKGKPQLSDLRESGAIEQDADIVMFIHRPDLVKDEKALDESKVRKNVAEIYIEKHRNGRTDMFKLYFKGETTKFLNINSQTGEPEGEISSAPAFSKPQAVVETAASSASEETENEDNRSNNPDAELFK